MTFPLEYHDVVRFAVKRPAKRSGRCSTQWALTIFSVLLLPSIFASTSLAQITSSNSSGSAHSGSVAPFTGSVAPPTGSIAPPTGAPSVHTGNVTFTSGLNHSTNFPHSVRDSHDFGGHHPHHRSSNDNFVYPYYPYGYAVPVPYAADSNDADSDDDDPDYQGGPTIFDRRGSGRDSYIPPTYPGPAHAPQGQRAADQRAEGASASEPSAASAPETPQPPTTLVFKDGRQVEVGNYAIVSQTLYDLTPGHPRKIALADLDLAATQKQNDDRGVPFQLPPSALAN
jgi:hypothetical protein